MSKFKTISLFGLVIALFSVFLALPLVFKVNIFCKSQYGSCPNEINSQLKINNGKSIAGAKNGVNRILKHNLLISDYSTQFKFPNILIVNILIKKPIFAIRNESNQIELIGEDGHILELSDSTGLPTLIITGNLKKVGEEIDTNQSFALKLIQGINDMYQINTGTVVDNSLVVELPTSIKVLFPLDGDTQILLGSLRVVYTKVESDDQKGRYKEIDLRFKNPVLR